MFKFLLLLYFIFSFNIAFAGITGTPAPKDHKAVANNTTDDNHEHNNVEETKESDNTDY